MTAAAELHSTDSRTAKTVWGRPAAWLRSGALAAAHLKHPSPAPMAFGAVAVQKKSSGALHTSSAICKSSILLCAHLQAQDAGASRDKVASVVVGVEPYEVGLEHGPQHLLAHWQAAVDL